MPAVKGKDEAAKADKLPYRCVACSEPVPSLYLQYSNASHNSLLQCSHCRATASDVYQTYPVSLLLVDMLLFKRGVYRHLLWNRGPADLQQRQRERTKIALLLGGVCILVEAFIRCVDIEPELRSQHPIRLFLRACAYCTIENVSLLLSVAASARVGLALQRGRAKSKSRPVEWATLPLALAYAYVPALFLLVISSVIWRTEYTTSTSSDGAHPDSLSASIAASIAPYLPDSRLVESGANSTLKADGAVSNALFKLASLSRNNLHSGIARVGRTRGWANEAIIRKAVGGGSALISISVMLNTSRIWTGVVLLLAWLLHLASLHIIDPWLA